MGYAKTTSRIDSWNRRETLNESLASAGLSFFDKGDDVCMSNESCDLLYDVAVAWKELTQYYYIFTYGYKKQLYTINLSFPPGEISTSCRVSIFEYSLSSPIHPEISRFVILSVA